MSSVTDFPVAGKVISTDVESVVFAPINTNYELKLLVSKYAGPVGERINAYIKVKARKLLTVPRASNFVTPIFGPPRIVQGRIKYLDEKQMVVQAGLPVIVELPQADNAFDMSNGLLAVGNLVNATIFPGATFELASTPVAAG